ncbi:hypothetical protein ACKVWM_011706 [Pyricularia oryzae]
MRQTQGRSRSMCACCRSAHIVRSCCSKKSQDSKCSASCRRIHASPTWKCDQTRGRRCYCWHAVGPD